MRRLQVADPLVRTGIVLLLGTSFVAKILVPMAPELRWPREATIALLVVELALILGLLAGWRRWAGWGCIGMGLGGLVWIALAGGRPCGCFGGWWIVGWRIHLALAGLLLAGGCQLLATARQATVGGEPLARASS